MYTFLDKGGRSITLRPELTAGVVRAYIENGFASEPTPLKFWYTGNMYRYEKMQKGRYREFKQFGVEIFGSDSYLADIETIMISRELLKRINLLDQVTLNINSIGCKTCRLEYIKKLKEYLKPNIDKMCDTCKRRYEKNPMRIIDCKEEKCQEILKNVPLIVDCLCDECKKDFELLKKGLEVSGIPYKIDKRIVRGLDYYNNTVYEYTSEKLGLAVGGGGRYDTLVETLGGPSTKAVGFGMGLDRIELVLKECGILENLKNELDLYFVTLNSDAKEKVLSIIQKLRENGIICDFDICNRSFNSQLKYANKQNAKFVCILGDEEIENSVCNIKNMETGIQEKIPLSSKDIMNYIISKK
jgi:histidyl-tRNA synthetase